jgi:hypothetical protein
MRNNGDVWIEKLKHATFRLYMKNDIVKNYVLCFSKVLLYYYPRTIFFLFFNEHNLMFHIYSEYEPLKCHTIIDITYICDFQYLFFIW